ncbi:cysteine-rich secretory protein LCCL domain-containing 2-like isoform X2 [Dendropsophus ebraccatus]
MKLLIIFITVAIYRYAEASIQSCSQGYAVLLLCSTTSKDLPSAISEVYCPSGCINKNLSVWGTDIYTENTRICPAAIHAGKVSNGGGYITVQKMPGQDKYNGSTKNGITSQNYGVAAKSFIFTSYPTQTVSSNTPPTSTIKTTPSTMASSSISTAPNTTAATTPGTSVSSTTFLTSSTATSISSSAPVTSATATSTTRQTSTPTTMMTATYIGQVFCIDNIEMYAGDPLMALCPPNCDTSYYYVYGTDIYASMSDLCPSAIHAGATTAKGGYVTVKRYPLQSTYTGSIRNGIKSSSASSPACEGSFMFI